MAFSLNKVMLIGNLGADAEHRVTTNDVSVTTFSLATTYSYKGRDGNWVDETTWHNIVAYRLSDYIKDNLKKGKKFYVEGRIKKRSYEDKEGRTVYVTEIVAERMFPLDSQAGGATTEGFTSEPSSPDASDGNEDDLPF